MYKGTKVFGSTADTLMLITGLYAGSTYSMSVKAKDAVAYASNMSDALKVTVLLTSAATKEKNMIEVYPNPATLNSSGWNSGIYIIQIQSENEFVTEKIVIE